MAGTREERSELQKAEHRRQIAHLYLRGVPLESIWQQLGIARRTFFYDLKAIHAEWRKEMLGDFDERKARELAKIDALEQEAWEAWRESKAERVITATKRVSGERGRDEAAIRKEKRDGAVQYLGVIQWAIEQRCKIFGFYAPARLSIDEMDKIIDAMMMQPVAGQDGDTPASYIQ